MALQFELLDQSLSLYRSANNNPAWADRLYYLMVGDGVRANPLDFQTAWRDRSGVYFFLPTDEQIDNAQAFVDALKELFGQSVPESQWIGWIPTAKVTNGELHDVRLVSLIKQIGKDQGRVIDIAQLEFGNLELVVQRETLVEARFDPDKAAIFFQANLAVGGTLTLKQIGTSRSLDLPANAQLDVPLDSVEIGAWSFPLSPDRGDFYALFQAPDDFSAGASAEVRFTYRLSEDLRSLRYPVLLGGSPDPRKPVKERLPLNVTIDPLAPTQSSRTRFAFDLAAYQPGGAELPLSLSFRTTAGHLLRLKPIESAGFSLARRPGGGITPEPPSFLYLTPAGPYEAESLQSLKAKAQPIAEGAMLIMCGLSGLEFLLVAEQDRIEFTGEFPANAPFFDSQNPSRGGSLDGAYSTAWMRVLPGPQSSQTFQGFIKQSYCVQARGAVYFFRDANSPFSFPMAIGARLASLVGVSTLPAFPMAPYGWVFYSDPDRGIDNPNPEVPGETLVRFEDEVVSWVRREKILVDQCLGPLFFDMSNLGPLKGGYVKTPQGLLVELNDGAMDSDKPAGSWKRLILAKSPENPDQLVQFNPSKSPDTHRCAGSQPFFDVVSPLLSTAFMSNAPFVVITVPKPLGSFDNFIQLGDYPFRLGVKGTDDGASLGTNTVLAFKLSADRSFKDLAADVGPWTDKATFVDTGTADRLSNQMGAFIAEAQELSDEAKREGAYDYFEEFLRIVKSDSWTGVIVLNPPLELTKLPLDLLALLGGMNPDKPLRGHHFGITLNHIKQAKDGQIGPALPLEKSSLFALVHYDEAFHAPPGDLDFQVLRLNALFQNSTLKHFDSQVAFSTQKLFGDPVTMVEGGKNDKPETNTIVIDGALQVQAGKTSIVFATTEVRVFEFPSSHYRTISQMVVNSAALQPIDSASQGNKVIVRSAFVYNGVLGFNARPVSAGPPADLFSFDVDLEDLSAGFQYSAYNFPMTTTVTDGSAELDEIATNVAGLQIDISNATPRENSLFATLPLQLVGFTIDASASGPGARKVSGADAGLDNVDHLDYAFVMQLAMGTLGALSTQSPLQGFLLLGWNSGREQAKADSPGMIFQPPKELLSTGGFRLQGVFTSQYGDVRLARPQLTNDEGSIYVFALSLVPVMFAIIGLPLVPLGAIRSLTFFGDFESLGSEEGTNLAWFVGEPLSNPTELSAEEAMERWEWAKVPARFVQSVPAAGEGSLVFTPGIGVLAGLEPSVDPEATQVIGDSIDILNTIPLSTKTTLNDIYNGTASLPVKYNPTAGVTVWVDIDFINITFRALFSDPAIYGARLEVASAPEKASGLWQALGGLVIEIAYRKISDELGAWSAFLTLPDKFRVIEFNEKLKLYLPTVGVIIYTNSDWRVDVGWPFSPDVAIRLDFEIKGIPFSAALGFYLAKLRSADNPEVFGTEFAVIWRFGVGISFGLAKDFEKGPLSLSMGIYGFITFEGFLASKHGALVQYGVDYHWFAGQLGIVIYASGSADFKILKASLDLEARLVLGWAIETNHRTALIIIATFSVSFSLRIIFVTITLSFSATWTIANWSFGNASLPVAQTDGPSPTSLPALAMDSRLAALHSGVRKELFAPFFSLAARAAVTAQTDVTVSLVLQPTAIGNDAGSQPYAVASLLIDLLPASPSMDEFAKLVQGIANWLYQQYAGGGTLSGQLDRILENVKAGNFERSLITCLSTTFRFHILPGSQHLVAKNAAVFPMFPQLKLTYNNKEIPFDQPQVPVDYAAQLAVYFSQLAASPAGPAHTLTALLEAGVPQSGAGVVFTDAFNLLAKQIVGEMQSLAEVDPTLTFQEALALLGPAGYTNIAGSVSRYAQYGLRLPQPDTVPFGSKLTAVFDLTRQQQAITSVNGVWNTAFELSYGTIDVKSWIVFGGATPEKSVVETMNPNLVFTEKINPTWLTSGGGFRGLPPLRPSRLQYYLGDQRVWRRSAGEVSQLRPFSNALQIFLAEHAPLTAEVEFVDPKTISLGAEPVPELQNAAAVLFIALQLVRIFDNSGAAIPDVYQLAGTDEYTRSQMEDLLGDERVLADAKLNMLAPLGNSAYRSSKNDASIVLAKTNLSTLSQPPTAVFMARAQLRELPSPPTSAKLENVSDFLWLTWEVSVVHSGGFFLYMADLPEDAFEGGRAEIALLVTLGAPSLKPALARYQNALLFDTIPPSEKTVALSINDQDGPVNIYQPNYPAGSLGFEIQWPAAPVMSGIGDKPTPAEKEAYLVSLYNILQYRVESVQFPAGLERLKASAPQLPSNWSLPIGPRGEQNWVFRQTLPVAHYLGESNRYAPVTMDVGFGVALLDMFGNALTQSLHPVRLRVVYNDPLIPVGSWPWMQSVYTFHKGEGNHAALVVEFTLRPPWDEKSSESVVQQAARDAEASYVLILEQLTDPNASTDITSILFEGPLNNQNGLSQQLGAYIRDRVLPYTRALQNGPIVPPPYPLIVEFQVERSGVARIKTDIFELTIALNIQRDLAKVDPAVRKLLPSVQKVSSLLAAMVDPLQQGSPAGLRSSRDDSTLRAFAKSFEAAWAGFDGKSPSTALLKVAEGAQAAGSGNKAHTNRQLWCVRLGKDAGIVASFPNATSTQVDDIPVYFSPIPLSTQLITRVANVRVYATGNVSTHDVDRVFSNVDMDIWARAFLAAVEGLLSPVMSTATATLDPVLYANLLAVKRDRLSLAMQGGLQTVLQVPGQHVDLRVPQERFYQALLNSLTADYTVASVLSVPADVTVVGTVNPKYPPNLYGDVKPPTVQLNHAISLTPAKLPTRNGRMEMPYMVSTNQPAEQAFVDISPAYQIGFVEHDFEPERQRFGYVPSSWITFIEPVVNPPGTGDPLNPPMGRTQIPIPLRAYPNLPSLPAQSAQVVSKASTIGEALYWSYRLNISVQRIPQDTLIFRLIFNDTPPTKTLAGSPSPVTFLTASGNVDPPRNPPQDLFEALARFTFEYPQIEPGLAGVPAAAFAGKDVPAAQLALQRMVTIIRGAADTWGSWRNPALTTERQNSRQLRSAQVGKISQLPTEKWIYQVVFNQLPNLVVKRSMDGSKQLPPWPLIQGFTSPDASGPVGVYTAFARDANPSGLVIDVPAMFIVTRETVRADAYIERNSNLVPDQAPPGTKVNEAFIYRTSDVELQDPVVPLVDIRDSIALPSSSTLSDAIDALFDPFVNPSGPSAQDEVDELRFELGVSYRYEIAEGETNQAIFSGLPIFLLQEYVTTTGQEKPGMRTLEELKKDLVASLAAWYKSFLPGDKRASLGFSFTLFTLTGEVRLPLAQFQSIAVSVPDNNPGWWS